MFPSLILAAALLIPYSPEWIEVTGHDLEPPQIASEAAQATEPTFDVEVSRGMGNGTSDVAQWEPLVAGHFSDLGQEAVDMALRIMACESGGNAHARNPRSTATGLMQIMAAVWGPEYGFSRTDLEKPEINLWVARKVYDQQGWNAWSCWRR